MLNVTSISVDNAWLTSHCASTVEVRKVRKRGVRKWEQIWFKTTAEDGERGGTAVTCDGRLFHRRAAATGNALSPTVDRRVGYVEYPETLMRQNVVVIWFQCLLVELSSSHRYVGASFTKQFRSGKVFCKEKRIHLRVWAARRRRMHGVGVKWLIQLW